MPLQSVPPLPNLVECSPRCVTDEIGKYFLSSLDSMVFRMVQEHSYEYLNSLGVSVQYDRSERKYGHFYPQLVCPSMHFSPPNWNVVECPGNDYLPLPTSPPPCTFSSGGDLGGNGEPSISLWGLSFPLGGLSLLQPPAQPLLLGSVAVASESSDPSLLLAWWWLRVLRLDGFSTVTRGWHPG
jgi:hypothetical protein